MNETRIFGPPGTGKTYNLTGEVQRLAAIYGTDSIRIASFTRAAAENIAGRTLTMKAEHIGTLHALCYRSMNLRNVIDLNRKQWREQWVQDNPGLAFRAPGDNESKARGDQLLGELELARARMLPLELMSPRVRDFSARWEEFKRKHSAVDFTDMIERALQTMDTAPGKPKVLIVDEAQDFSKLENALINKWAPHCEVVLKAGDDDQTIYEWKGADPEGFINGNYEERILDQSYRIPARVQGAAEVWIKQVEHRVAKNYRARDEEGTVSISSSSWSEPKKVLRAMEPYLEAGKSVMFLAYCEYMLAPLIGEMKKAGLTFHNPYAVDRGSGWNPLLSTEHVVSSADRLLSYLKPDIEVWGDDASTWRAYELHRWLSVIKVDGVLKRGAKKMIAELADTTDKVYAPLTIDDYLQWFEPDELMLAFGGDLNWFENHLLPSLAQRMQYPLNVARLHGAAKLREEPRIMVGTIHSVKGGEADVVMLCPDLSPKGAEGFRRNRDAVVRTFYVGMTRARNDLVICRPSERSGSGRSVRLATAATKAGVV